MTGSADFRRLLGEHLDELIEAMAAASVTDPTFARVIAAAPPKESEARLRLWRRAIERATVGELGPLEEFLRVRGASLARQGVPLPAALKTLRAMQDRLVLIAVYALAGEEPGRLGAALEAALAFFNFAESTLGSAYLEAKDAEIREIVARNVAVLDIAPDAVVTISHTGTVLAANPAAERIFGRPRASIVGAPVSNLLAPEEHPAHRARLAALVAATTTPPPATFDAIMLRGPVDVRFVAELRVARADGEHGPTFTGFIRDVTEQREAQGLVLQQRDAAERNARALLASEERLRNLAARLHAIREDEGRRIAREVHDTVGQALTSVRMDLSWLVRHSPSTIVEVNERRESMFTLLDSALDTVRRIVTEIRPGVLDDLGLEAAIGWQAAQFQKRTGIEILVNVGKQELDIPPEHSTALFRVFQELLTNVARHADATTVHVLLVQMDGATVLEVQDNGRGITDAEANRSDSIGVLGMRERLLLHGGTLTLSGNPGEGTRACARIPLADPKNGVR